MKQLFFASTLTQVITLAAGIDEGAYDTGWIPQLATLPLGAQYSDLRSTDSARRRNDYPRISERILVVSNNSYSPETAYPLWSLDEAQPALKRFDRVIDLNVTIFPKSPSTWNPTDTELPAWERLLRTQWDLGDSDLELIVESPQVNPAAAVGRIFHTAYQRVHADGLMSFGPTRNQIALTNAQRMTSLHYLPYVEIDPVLLSEAGIVPVPLAWDSFRAVVAETAEAVASELDAHLSELRKPTAALVTGQYLAALNILTEDEEQALHLAMIDEAAKRGAEAVVFKPHPSAPAAAATPLRKHAERHGLKFVLFDHPVIAEAVIEYLHPDMVIGCFSTALAVARAAYGIPAIAVGAKDVLEKVVPFENSNRVPLVLCDILMDGRTDDLSEQQAERLQGLISAISYAARPQIVPHLRPAAEEFLTTAQHTSDLGYFRRRRLTKLSLPGALPKKKWAPNGRIEKRLPTPLLAPYRKLRRRVRTVQNSIRPTQR